MALFDPEYAVQKITDRHFIVHKFCGFHWSYLGGYIVKKSTSDSWYCDCVAQGKCKHITMVLNEINPRKDLF
jgi:hypothetical protein